MKVVFATSALKDYRELEQKDIKIFKRINRLLQDIKKTPFSGIGKPEPLKHKWTGYWSRRITQEHRLVYKVSEDKIFIAQCKFHY
ncbi:MAG: Txe/YoeB family addiction module toxin [Cyanobacteria bacterium J06621_12]